MTRQLPPLVKWLLGIFATLITASVIGGGATLANHSEDLAAQGAKVQGLKEGQQRIEAKQDRLDMKLDRIMNHLLQQ